MAQQKDKKEQPKVDPKGDAKDQKTADPKGGGTPPAAGGATKSTGAKPEPFVAYMLAGAAAVAILVLVCVPARRE